MHDAANELQEKVRQAHASETPLRIVGGDTKAFYGRAGEGEELSLRDHRDVVSYEPTELVLTARAGTPLAEIELLLRDNGQMLPFEPPHFGGGATIGGTIACGLSGPRRAYAGAARDFVLGTRILTGDGQWLRFGGEVMKNVAGYDVSRLMCGSLGTLGVIGEVSLKVLPAPAAELTLALDLSPAEAMDTASAWAGKPLPISATCHDGERFYVRLSGATTAVTAARRRLGGEVREDDAQLWERVREQRHGFFSGDGPLWRLALPAGTPLLDLAGKWLLEWGGSQRWLRSPCSTTDIRDAAQRNGGHATLFRGGDRTSEVFQPLPAPLDQLQRRLKAQFDPRGILNAGRLYLAW